MYSIYEKIPVYTDRDAIGHSIIRKVSEYAYETAALAQRLTPSSYDEDGQCNDRSFFVADAADPWKRVSTPCRDTAAYDIPF